MKKIAIIGAGLIGRSWAVVFAKSGFSVQMYDQSVDALDTAPKVIAQSLRDLEHAGLLSRPIQAVLNQISYTDCLADSVADASFVQENVRETLETKLKVFSELDLLTPNESPIASSTSWIPASKFTQSLRGRKRCLVGHPINPPHVVPLVEICPAPWTSTDVVSVAKNIYLEAGQRPVILKKEITGFLVNRVQGAVLNEVMSLHSQGYASVADLDSVMRDGLGLRWAFMGPFETIDLNAPGGVVDYASRFSETYQLVASESLPFSWDIEAIRKIDLERRQLLALADIVSRSVWRDRFLMDLTAQKVRSHRAQSFSQKDNASQQ